jgi:hypothetical protein
MGFLDGGKLIVKTLVLPDTEAWRECLTEAKWKSCAWASTDLPWLKAGKLLKLKKVDEVADAAQGAKGCKCFLAGTGVLMADGAVKNIEDIELGDKVLATDPETGETGEREVTATIVTEDDKHFVDLTISTPEGEEHLTATHEHPFWSVSRREWIPASDLRPGTLLRTDDARTVTVTHTRQYTAHARTYNLTVAGVHTYYALAGETPVLVHNSSACSVGEARRLQAQLAAEELAGANGHAFQKHVVEQGEFPGIKTRAQFAELIESVILKGEQRGRADGTTAFWRNGVIVIRNPNSRDGGTVFAPKEGREYFTRNFKK